MTNTRRWLVAGAALVASMGLVAACGGDGGSPASGAGGDPTTTAAAPDVEYTDLTGQPRVTVEAVDNNMVPQFVEVSKGTVITFVNEGRNVHNLLPVEPGSFPPVETGSFDSGASVDLTFDEVGEFGYYCSLHGTATKGMFGSVKVV